MNSNPRALVAAREATFVCVVRAAMVSLLLAAFAVCTLGEVADARVSLTGPTQTLNSNADSDGDTDDRGVQVAGDLFGNWVALWAADIATDFTLFSRSTDDGRTWSPAEQLTMFTGALRIAVSATGTWLASAGGNLYRSTDAGENWNMVRTRGATGIATDDAGNWIVVESDEVVPYDPDRDVFFSLSTDDGLTFSPLAPVDNEALGDTLFDSRDATVATDTSGRWIVVWQVSNSFLRYAITTDLGTTWTDPGNLNVGGIRPEIDTDRNGTWMITGHHLPGRFSFDPVQHSRSVDNGVTWSTPELAFPGSDADSNDSTIRTDREGNWYLAYQTDAALGTLGSDNDVVIAASADNGETFGLPTPLDENAGGTGPGSALEPALAYNDAGTWIVAWGQEDTIAVEDVDLRFGRWTDDCPMAPRVGCEGIGDRGKAKISMKSRDTLRDDFRLTWRGSESMDVSEFGSPLTTTGYALCVYDHVGATPRLVFEMDAAAGGQCGSSDCWGAKPTGFRYFDSGNDRGPTRTWLMRSGSRTKFKISAGGIRTVFPALPFEENPEVLVQVSNLESSRCWEVGFSGDSKNNGDSYRAKAD